MPLFSNKNKHATDTRMTGATSGLNSRPYESTNLNRTNVIPRSGLHPEGGTIDGRREVPGQTGPDHIQGMYGNDGPGIAGIGAHQHNHMPGTTVGGVGMAAGAGTLPPANVLSHSDQSRRGGGGQAFTGKVERTVGSLIGSDSLKAKGLQKEQEANSYKVQGAELAEAERLEREALLRRERAVGHGAHPDNKHLGAGYTSPPGGGY